MDEIIKCDHSNKNCWAILCYGAAYLGLSIEAGHSLCAGGRESLSQWLLGHVGQQIHVVGKYNS